MDRRTGGRFHIIGKKIPGDLTSLDGINLLFGLSRNQERMDAATGEGGLTEETKHSSAVYSKHVAELNKNEMETIRNS